MRPLPPNSPWPAGKSTADAEGKVFGVTLTAEAHQQLEQQLKRVLYDLAFATMDKEAIRAALANPVRHSMEEVIKMVESRPTSEENLGM